MSNHFGETKKDRVFRMVARNVEMKPEHIAHFYESLYKETMKVSTAKAYRNEFLKLARENIEINETSGLRSYGPTTRHYSVTIPSFWIKVAIAGLLTGALLQFIF